MKEDFKLLFSGIKDPGDMFKNNTNMQVQRDRNCAVWYIPIGERPFTESPEYNIFYLEEYDPPMVKFKVVISDPTPYEAFLFFDGCTSLNELFLNNTLARYYIAMPGEPSVISVGQFTYSTAKSIYWKGKLIWQRIRTL